MRSQLTLVVAFGGNTKPPFGLPDANDAMARSISAAFWGTNSIESDRATGSAAPQARDEPCTDRIGDPDKHDGDCTVLPLQ